MHRRTDKLTYKVIIIIIFIESINKNVMNEDIIKHAKIKIDSVAVGHSL